MHKYSKFNLVAAIGILILTLACDKDQQSKVVINSFNMSVNGEPWKPTGSVSDPCYGNYDCQWSAINGVSFYNINATRDLMPEAGITNNNLFQLQIMGVTGPDYPLRHQAHIRGLIKHQQCLKAILINAMT